MKLQPTNDLTLDGIIANCIAETKRINNSKELSVGKKFIEEINLFNEITEQIKKCKDLVLK